VQGEKRQPGEIQGLALNEMARSLDSTRIESRLPGDRIPVWLSVKDRRIYMYYIASQLHAGLKGGVQDIMSAMNMEAEGVKMIDKISGAIAEVFKAVAYYQENNPSRLVKHNYARAQLGWHFLTGAQVYIDHPDIFMKTTGWGGNIVSDPGLSKPEAEAAARIAKYLLDDDFALLTGDDEQARILAYAEMARCLKVDKHTVPEEPMYMVGEDKGSTIIEDPLKKVDRLAGESGIAGGINFRGGIAYLLEEVDRILGRTKHATGKGKKYRERLKTLNKKIDRGIAAIQKTRKDAEVKKEQATLIKTIMKNTDPGFRREELIEEVNGYKTEDQREG